MTTPTLTNELPISKEIILDLTFKERVKYFSKDSPGVIPCTVVDIEQGSTHYLLQGKTTIDCRKFLVYGYHNPTVELNTRDFWYIKEKLT